ncbi:MAG: Mce-associated rane protein [Mycobacterium sp.]|nr:Mce-associated rane protein [Mycobacterium sp.]
MRTATKKGPQMAVDTEIASTPTTTGENAEAGKHSATSEVAASDEVSDATPVRSRFAWTRVVAFGILPGVALILALGAGYAKWRNASVRDAQVAGIEAVQTAKDGTVALLAYRPDTVEKDLTAARDRLTGAFRDSYTSLTDDVVIPGAKQKLISAAASVPAAALVSASDTHSVVLVFVDQTTTLGSDAPTNTASSVRVTLDKINGRWLISGFDPV